MGVAGVAGEVAPPPQSSPAMGGGRKLAGDTCKDCGLRGILASSCPTAGVSPRPPPG